VLGSLAKHSFGAILLAVVIEELGLPMPIPTDVMIVFAGTAAADSMSRLALLFVALAIASAAGGSGLYAIVRRGGRPLVDRFGRYVHLGPEQLARAEAMLARGGWKSIAVGRAIPGLRYATGIACGLLKVPYLRYVTAHIAGSSVYIATFLVLGAVFGPTILDRIHLPALGVRLLWLSLLAVGLPLLILWWARRLRPRPADPSRGRSMSAALLASFAGTTALTAVLSAAATVAELFGASHPLNVAYALLDRLLLDSLAVNASSLLLYAILLSLLAGVAVLYYELVLPYLAVRALPPLWDILALALLAFGVFGGIFLSSLLLTPDASLDLWQQTGGPIMLLGSVLGVMVYASTVVYGRILAMAMTPTVRHGTR
jgi:membrane protein DedA with SNARE-associated domain